MKNIFNFFKMKKENSTKEIDYKFYCTHDGTLLLPDYDVFYDNLTGEKKTVKTNIYYCKNCRTSYVLKINKLNNKVRIRKHKVYIGI